MTCYFDGACRFALLPALYICVCDLLAVGETMCEKGVEIMTRLFVFFSVDICWEPRECFQCPAPATLTHRCAVFQLSPDNRWIHSRQRSEILSLPTRLLLVDGFRTWRTMWRRRAGCRDHPEEPRKGSVILARTSSGGNSGAGKATSQNAAGNSPLIFTRDYAVKSKGCHNRKSIS